MADRVRRGYDRALELLERLVPIARVLRGALLGYALVVAASVLAIAVVLVRRDVPGVWFTWLAFGLLVVVLAAAPAVILFFVWMLKEVLELPGKLRALPDVGPARAAELAQLVREARQPVPPGAERRGSIPGDVWRAGRLMFDLYDALPFPGPVRAIVRWPLLIAVLLALVFGFFEIVVAMLLVAASLVSLFL